MVQREPFITVKSSSFAETVALLGKVFGSHFDVVFDQEIVTNGDRSWRESVIRIYPKGTREVSLSMWLDQV